MPDPRDPGNASDELQQLLGGVSGSEKGKKADKKSPKKPGKKASKTTPAKTPQAAETVDQALNELSSGSQNPGNNDAQFVDIKPQSHDTKIESLLGDQIKAQVERKNSNEPQTPVEKNSLDTLISQANSPESVAEKIKARAAESRRESLQEQLHAQRHQRGKKTDKDKVAFQWANVRYRSLWLTIAVILGAIALWVNTQEHHLYSQDTLYKLAKDVKHFQDQNDFLPGTLTEFHHFPEDAIQWPIEYWDARNMAGKTEIIWIPYENGRFTIILRKPQGTWYYDSVANKVSKAEKQKR